MLGRADSYWVQELGVLLWPLRLLFAARPEVLTRVLNVVARAVLKRVGLSRSAGAETGIVTFIQRFGSALNLNIHLHMLVLDGAYTFTHDRARFHRAPEHLAEFAERLSRPRAIAGTNLAHDKSNKEVKKR